MSLDLGPKLGRTAAYIDGSAGADFSTLTAASFTEGDLESAGKFIVYYKQGGDTDVTGGSADAFPLSLIGPNGGELFEDGTELTVVKINTDAGKLVFKDPKSGVVYSYLDRQGESMSFIFDTVGGVRKWVAKV